MSTEETSPEDAPSPVVRRRSPVGEGAPEPAEAAPAEAPVVEAEPPAPEPSQAMALPSLDQLLGRHSPLLAEEKHEGSALEADDLGAAEQVAAELNEDFAALLAAEGGMVEFKPGDRIRGKIVSITDGEVFVDVGAKSEAWLSRRELCDPSGKLLFELGQDIEAQVIRADGEGVRLSYGALQARVLSEQLADAAASGIPVEGRVEGFNEGGLEVRVGNRRAFCPKSQIDRVVGDDLSVHVGRTYRFVVRQYDETGRNIVLSRRILLEREAKEQAAETRKVLQVGAILDGRVRKVMPFGVFVDLGGIDGLVHISEMSWERVEDPATVVQEGDAVQVKVLKMDGKRDRIGLSMRQAAGDPWKGLKDRYEASKTYTGTVTRLADFGAFVALEPGVEGLVHISEFDWTRRISHPKEVVAEGEQVEVLLLELDPRKKRMSLSIKQAGEDPWKAGMGEVSVGDRIQVTVEKVADFGVFATISPGVTGLVPNREMNTARDANHRQMFKPGATFEVAVIEVDKRRRKVTLSRKALVDAGAKEDFKAYQTRLKEEQSGGESAFALAFKAAQERQNKR